MTIQYSKIKSTRNGGFTLVEMLVSIAVLVLMLVMLTEVLSNAQKVWSGAISSTQQFREARVAFEAMTRRISQAVINTYWDYNNENSPQYYVRQSELHFICGPRDGILANSVTSPTQTGNADGNTDAIFFIAPLGYTTSASTTTGTSLTQLNALLNAWGYYIAYGSDVNGRPPFLQQDTTIIPAKYRFRLYEFRQPSQSLQIYNDNYLNGQYVASNGTNQVTIQQNGSASVTATRTWYQNILGTTNADTNLIPQQGSSFSDGSQARIIADNIIALIISPRYPGIYINGQQYPDFYYAPNYYQDSRSCLINNIQLTATSAVSQPQIVNTGNTLPPMVQVTMVALDETSAARYATLYSNEDMPPVKAVEQAGYTNLFQWVSSAQGSPSTNSTDDQYQQDLTSFETWLTSQHLNYEVFRMAIPIRAAKFSAPQQ